MVDLFVLVVVLTLIHLVDSLSCAVSAGWGGGGGLIPWRLHAVLFCLSLAFKKG